MLYEDTRQEIINLIEDLKFYGLIECTGGAISCLLDNQYVLITASGCARKRWQIQKEDFIVLDMEGRVVERTSSLGPIGTPMHLAIYNLFDHCKAIMHTHAKNSLVYAVKGIPIPNSIEGLDILGEIPCLMADRKSIYEEIKKLDVSSIHIPEGMVKRPDSALFHERQRIPWLKDYLIRRSEELREHSIAFTEYRHGVYVLGRTLGETFTDLARIESGAYASMNQGSLA